MVLPKAKEAGRRILATAGSNVAVDAIVAGLVKDGINVVRIGKPARVRHKTNGTQLELLAAQLALFAGWFVFICL